MIDALLLALIGGFVYWLCCRAVKYYDNHKKDQSTTNVAMPQLSEDEFDRLNAKAKELGSTTVFTAKQVGDAFLEIRGLYLR